MLASANCVVSVQPGEPPIVKAVGEINYESAACVRETLETLWRDGAARIVMDCSSVEFIDSSGIGAVIYCAQKLKRTGGELVLKAATPQFLHALQISGFADLLSIERAFEDKPEHERRRSISGLWQQIRFSIPMPADRDGLVRRRVTELAQAMPFSQGQVDDVRLAVGEAVSNAIKHGCTGGENNRFNVYCTGDDEKLVIEFNYPGEEFDPDMVPIPDPDNPREGGMGIFFMKATMDVVNYAFDETGTTVKMIKYIGAENTDNDNRS